uniref:Uncharacterized protein n=1 Tax=Trypanosoma vivax (strain Y486) TaxID=1055687 RepID=G0U8U3_TRYVY|nr:hypothetical protein, unlikely [Trypanosoma vivax Y486]
MRTGLQKNSFISNCSKMAIKHPLQLCLFVCCCCYWCCCRCSRSARVFFLSFLIFHFCFVLFSTFLLWLPTISKSSIFLPCACSLFSFHFPSSHPHLRLRRDTSPKLAKINISLQSSDILK